MPKNNPNLFTHATNGEIATKRVVDLLETIYKLRVTPFGSGIRVTHGYHSNHDFSYVEFSLHDNGGEINVEPVNSPERLKQYYPAGLRSIPSESNLGTITAEIVAYRLYLALTGQEIDYQDFNAPGIGLDPLVINNYLV